MRFATLLSVAALCALPVHAVDPDRAEQFYMQVQESNLPTGLQTEIVVMFNPVSGCTETDTDPDCLLTPLTSSDLLTPLTTPEVKAVKWKVNGILGGNSKVGTISGSGAHVYYTAPYTAPKRNPVAISAEVEGERGLTLVGEITVVPGSGWRGELSWQFAGESEEATAGSRGHKQVKIRANATYKIAGLITDSYNDDASGMVYLNLIPTDADYSFTSTTKGDCTDAVHWEGNFEADESHYPWMVTVDLTADHNSGFRHVLSPTLVMSGYSDRSACVPGLKPERAVLETYSDVFPMFNGPFAGEAGDARTFKGEVTSKQETTIQGETVEGELTVRWHFVRD